MAVWTPIITQAGQAAAINADANGFELPIDAVAFGTAAYDPNGTETGLFNEVKRVSIAAGAMVTPMQARITAVWSSDTDDYPIREVGFFSGATLVFVWSRASGVPLGYKTPGVDFVLYNDLKMVGIPAGSITITVDDSGAAAALAALGAHEAAADPHAGYVRKALMPDAQAFLACSVGGTANTLLLTPAVGVSVTGYAQWQKFVFKATANNTGPATVNVAGLGVKAIKKNGSDELQAGDIRAGAVFELIYDGTAFQIAGGVGGAMAFTPYEFMATAGQTTFTASYTPGNVRVSRNGRVLSPSEYNDGTGTAIVLDEACIADDVVLIEAYQSFTLADAYTKAETDSGLALASEFLAPAMPWPSIINSSAGGSRVTITAASGAGTGGSVALPGGELLAINEARTGQGVVRQRRFTVPAWSSGPLAASSTYYVRARVNNGALQVYVQRGTDSDGTPSSNIGTPNAASGGGFHSTKLDALLAKVVTGAAGSTPTVTALANYENMTAFSNETGAATLISGTSGNYEFFSTIVMNWARPPNVTTVRGHISQSGDFYVQGGANQLYIIERTRYQITTRITTDWNSGVTAASGTISMEIYT